MVDGTAAAQWLLNYGAVIASRCLYYVWLAYKAMGASTSMGAQTAYSAWQQSDGQHPGDRNPPAGAAVWWGRRYRDGNMDGDVVISLGGGRVAVTEAPEQGAVTGSCTLDERENQVGREYLGWTSSIFDCPIALGGTTSGWTDADKQAFLDSLGYTTGAPGWGAMCAAATTDFQTKVNLNPDGDFGPKTTTVAEAIKAGGNVTSRATSDIQTALKAAGFDPGPIDNDWGVKTSFAEYRWQLSVALTADAVHGPASDARLFPPTPIVEGRNATDRPLKDIQTRLSIPQTGTWDQVTSDAVYAFQGAQGIDQDRVWGPTSDGLEFRPAGSIHGADYSFARPSVTTLQTHGVKFVLRYLWAPLYADGRTTNKGLSAAELALYRTAGIDVGLVYEEDGKELMGGFAAGVRVATAAEGFRTALGLSAQPIYFNVDFDIAPGDVPTVLAALDGAASVIGAARVGLYGGYSVIKAAFDAKKIAWGFQTYAWSNGQWDPRAQLQQWSNGQWGDTIDFTRAMVPEYGQHEVNATPAPDPTPDPTPVPGTVLTPEAAGFWQWLFEAIKRWFGGAK